MHLVITLSLFFIFIGVIIVGVSLNTLLNSTSGCSGNCNQGRKPCDCKDTPET